jgi:hypothetical protein
VRDSRDATKPIEPDRPSGRCEGRRRRPGRDDETRDNPNARRAAGRQHSGQFVSLPRSPHPMTFTRKLALFAAMVAVAAGASVGAVQGD